jgi:peptidoglycan hydrolase-like protein with peptidoglycan-binding domain
MSVTDTERKRTMNVQKIAVAAAILSLSGLALAAGNPSSSQDQGSSASSQQQTTSQSSSSSSGGSAEVRQAQQALKDKGFDVGQIDGQMGPHTQQALRSFQQQQNIQSSGQLDQQTLAALGVSSSSEGAQSSPSTQSSPSSSSSESSPSSSSTPSSESSQSSPSSTSQSPTSSPSSSSSYSTQSSGSASK